MSVIKVSDMPKTYQLQVLKQLGQTASPTAMTNFVTPAKGGHCIKPEREKPKNQIKVGGKRVQNDNEKGYNRLHLGGKGLYEAVILKLPGGSRYTPDYVTWDSAGRMTCHEVKGAYKLQSQGRAATAFRECVAAFPAIVFVWATNEKGEYNLQTFNSGLAITGNVC